MAKKNTSPFLWIALAGGAVFLYMRFRKKKTATQQAVDTIMWDVGTGHPSAASPEFDIEFGPATVEIL